MLRTGTICASLLYTYLFTDEENPNVTNDDISNNEILRKKKFKLQCLSKVFANSGGVLAKVAQIIDIDSGTNSLAFSECKPFNEKESIFFIQEEIKNNQIFSSFISEFNEKVFKSGSIAQIHRAKSINKLYRPSCD